MQTHYIVRVATRSAHASAGGCQHPHLELDHQALLPVLDRELLQCHSGVRHQFFSAEVELQLIGRYWTRVTVELNIRHDTSQGWSTLPSTRLLMYRILNF
jgi:superoxide dismutase